MRPRQLAACLGPRDFGGFARNTPSQGLDGTTVIWYSGIGGAGMVKLTLRLTEELHDKLRWLAFKERRSQHAIVMELLEKALAKVEVPKEVSR